MKTRLNVIDVEPVDTDSADDYGTEDNSGLWGRTKEFCSSVRDKIYSYARQAYGWTVKFLNGHPTFARILGYFGYALAGALAGIGVSYLYSWGYVFMVVGSLTGNLLMTLLGVVMVALAIAIVVAAISFLFVLR